MSVALHSFQNSLQQMLCFEFARHSFRMHDTDDSHCRASSTIDINVIVLKSSSQNIIPVSLDRLFAVGVLSQCVFQFLTLSLLLVSRARIIVLSHFCLFRSSFHVTQSHRSGQEEQRNTTNTVLKFQTKSEVRKQQPQPPPPPVTTTSQSLCDFSLFSHCRSCS